MTAAATKPFTAITHELADIEKINGKVFTMNMVYTYALIEGYQTNGQTAYFSQDMLKRRLGVTRQTVVKLLADMVAMGLINKTAQIGGKTCHYTVNPITPEMVGTTEAAKPEVTKPTAAPQPVETVENAGTNQHGIIECGSDSVHRSRPASPGASPVDHSGGAVRPAPVPVPVEQGAANDDLRNPVINYVAGSNVMMVNGLPVEYLEPEESAVDQFGDAF
ncbi:MarR family transcriptional regulator [Escherichia coli]|uniref:MarR family transcriptional regulator n=1 Tax=Escherichia coli TaxID=562 RepID=UPI0010B2622B|nr:helix-turn-helix domain-containing protein [Escherichia coli]EEW7958532.1 MarR family transcriptional regulator [Escherichia coli]EFC1560677.1 MarR family transcriptional regulator [Escherichia coli]EFO1167060.1 MarR family transcriptional regulator [Escherichia coli]EHA4278154.1 MarR family transcriptional regulator [Escherichia coli]EHE8691720.1 MarR family transcriptional regulator [Escherichia coli]